MEAGASDLNQSCAKADALAQDLSQATSLIYAHEAQALKAEEEAANLRQAAEGGAAALQDSLQSARQRAERLEQDLAAARHEVDQSWPVGESR